MKILTINSLDDLKKATSKKKLIFERSGCDTVTQIKSVRKANQIFGEVIEFEGVEALKDKRFTELGDILYIDNPSWIEAHEEEVG